MKYRKGGYIVKINQYLISLSISMIMIFGGVSIVRYIRMDDILLDQIIVASVGIIILISSLIYKRKNTN